MLSSSKHNSATDNSSITGAARSVLEDRETIMSMIHGMWRTRCLNVLVGFKIPELLCNTSKKSLSIEEIASQTGCASTNQIYHVLRGMAQWGIGVELEDKHFAKNQAMELLRKDNGPSMGHVVEFCTNDEMWKAAVSFPEAVKQDRPAFVVEHGMTHFTYMFDSDNVPYDPTKMTKCHFSEHPIGSNERRQELVPNYNEAMDMWSKLQILADEPSVTNVYQVFPWSSCKKLLDVGGNSGEFLASILKQPRCEHVQGYVADLPAVIDKAQQNVHNLGLPDKRIVFMKQDITEPLQCDLKNLKVDTILMKNVLNMIDIKCVPQVLKNCRRLLSDDGRCLIATTCIPEPGDTSHNVGENGFQWGFIQIHVMSLANGGKMSKNERKEQLTKIGAYCDLKVSKMYDTFNGGVTLFELRPCIKQ